MSSHLRLLSWRGWGAYPEADTGIGRGPARRDVGATRRGGPTTGNQGQDGPVLMADDSAPVLSSSKRLGGTIPDRAGNHGRRSKACS